MKLNYCYHTHTKRCGHAYGEDEEFVLEAINKGLKTLGFTDHIFLPNHSQPTIRGDFSLLDDYLNSLNYLKEKYKDKIEILIGFEAEYIESYLPYYESLLNEGKISYLIQGQHIYLNDNKIRWYFASKDDHKAIELYLSHLIEGMKSGLFSYVAHPDLFVSGLTVWDDFAIEISRKICEASIKYNVPLEFNLGGTRFPYESLYPGKKCLRYPSIDFWMIASEYPINIFIGSDAHRPQQINDEKEIEVALKIKEQLNLNLLEDIKKR